MVRSVTYLWTVKMFRPYNIVLETFFPYSKCSIVIVHAYRHHYNMSHVLYCSSQFHTHIIYVTITYSNFVYIIFGDEKCNFLNIVVMMRVMHP